MTRRAFVTGASKGIGRAIATLLADRGYAVAVAARSQDLLEGLARGARRGSEPPRSRSLPIFATCSARPS